MFLFSLLSISCIWDLLSEKAGLDLLENIINFKLIGYLYLSSDLRFQSESRIGCWLLLVESVCDNLLYWQLLWFWSCEPLFTGHKWERHQEPVIILRQAFRSPYLCVVCALLSLIFRLQEEVVWKLSTYSLALFLRLLEIDESRRQMLRFFIVKMTFFFQVQIGFQFFILKEFFREVVDKGFLSYLETRAEVRDRRNGFWVNLLIKYLIFLLINQLINSISGGLCFFFQSGEHTIFWWQKVVLSKYWAFCSCFLTPFYRAFFHLL